MRGSERSSQRGRILRSARTLARSGHFEDSGKVLEALVTQQDDAQGWFDDHRFRAQLDKLCELARERG